MPSFASQASFIIYNSVFKISNSHYTYFLILGISLSGPLLLSFDRKVAFYKEWKYVFPAMIIPALFYIVWDVYFTSIGIWSFNPRFISGVKLINLPIEEILFFFVVPYCCIFIYACIRTYFPAIKNTSISRTILIVIAEVLLFCSIIFYEKHYTMFTFSLLALFINIIIIFSRYFSAFNISAFLISYAIILFPFLIINGFFTAIPVVIYNDSENLGIRIHTIPFEDIFYGMLLIMMNVTCYEKIKAALVFKQAKKFN